MAEATTELTFTLTPAQALVVLEMADNLYDQHKEQLRHAEDMADEDVTHLESVQAGVDSVIVTLRDQFKVALDENQVDLMALRPDWFK